MTEENDRIDRIERETLGRIDFTATELAEAAGVSRQYIARLLKRGDIRGRQIGGKYWVIRKMEALVWLRSREARNARARELAKRDTSNE